jgi:hypothetical protein
LVSSAKKSSKEQLSCILDPENFDILNGIELNISMKKLAFYLSFQNTWYFVFLYSMGTKHT